MRPGASFGQPARPIAPRGYEVQTTRLATVPFPQLMGGKALDVLPTATQELQLLLEQIAVDYASLGPASPKQPRSYEVIPEAIAASKNVFFGAALTDSRLRLIDLDAVRLSAHVIVQCASLEANGFANLRFAALANVPPGSPFFPAAYHGAGGPTFAIATEAADLAVEAFSQARTVAEGQAWLTGAIQRHGDALLKIGRMLTRRSPARGPGNARRRDQVRRHRLFAGAVPGRGRFPRRRVRAHGRTPRRPAWLAARPRPY